MLENNKHLPNHIAIIMDGNGRWAKKRMMPRVFGHKKGVETLKVITRRAHQLGLKVLTVYAFSTENWSRPSDEVNYLMNLPKDFFDSFLPELMENNVKVSCMGDLAKLPEETRKILDKGLNQTKDNTGLILNIALNYGGQQEITQAVKAIGKDLIDGKLTIETIDQALIQTYLMTAPLGSHADPDLIIRTSGELRMSNFLLWQLAYSEFYFTDILWPDFKAEDFDNAIEDYLKRQRRYGKLT